MNSIAKTIFAASILLSTCPAQAALDSIQGEREKTSEQNYTDLSNHLDRHEKYLAALEEDVHNNQGRYAAMFQDIGEKIAFLRNAEIQYAQDEAKRKKMETFRLCEQEKKNELIKQIEKEQIVLNKTIQHQRTLEMRHSLAGFARG